ncbi:MAG: hypothetical protein ACOCUI_02785 [bacterium]
MVTKTEFFNNKRLWDNWFKKEDLNIEQSKLYRNYVNDFIKEFEWTTSLLVTVSNTSILSEINSKYYEAKEKGCIKIF